MWSAKYLIMMEGNMDSVDNVDSVDSEKVIPDIIEADETSPLLKRPNDSESYEGTTVSTHYTRTGGSSSIVDRTGGPSGHPV